MLRVFLFICLCMVAIVLKCVFNCFKSMFSTAFRRILQLLFWNVSEVDRMLHLSSSHLVLHLVVGSRSVGACRHGMQLVCSPILAGATNVIV